MSGADLFFRQRTFNRFTAGRVDILDGPACAQPVHLAPKTIDAPGYPQSDSQVFGHGPDIVLCYGPIHFPGRVAAVNIMVPQLQLLARHAPLQQVQNTGKAVFAAGEQDDDLIVVLQGQEAVQIDRLHMRRVLSAGYRRDLTGTFTMDSTDR